MDFFGLLIVFGVIIVSMVLHELAHGAVAYWLGDDTARDSGRLSLNPLKHLDPVLSILLPMMLAISGGPVFGGAKPIPVDGRRLKWDEWGMALVAVAGPATNILIAFIFFLIGHFSGLIYSMDYVGYIFQGFVFINLGFCIFNMLPIPPLDGSRVLYALAPEVVQRVMLGMERYGIIIVFGLIVMFGSVFSNIIGNAMDGVLWAFEWIVGV